MRIIREVIPIRAVGRIAALLVLGVLLLSASVALALPNASYTLSRWTVDGGGATFISGGGYVLGCTVGQPDARVLSGGGYILGGGFWGGGAAGAPPPNTPPQAAFNVSPGSGDTATVFSFDASGSSDAEDPTSALEVRWDWEDDGVYDTAWSTGKAATHTYGTTGIHTIRMQVRDSGGLTDSTPRQVTVVVASSNTAPTAAFNVSPTSGDTSIAFSFDGSGSSDAEDPASALEVRWDWEDDGVYDTGWSTTKTANHVFAISGTYTIRMEVLDSGGLSDAATQQVTVQEPAVNTPPQAAFNVSPGSGDTATVFSFDASGSSDAEDATSALEVRWDWEDDGTYDTGWSTTKAATHTYTTIGVHTIRMQVRDSGGLTDSVPRQVTVVAASSNIAPTAAFGISPGSGDTSTVFSFDGAGSSDAEDATSALEVRWDWEDDGVYDTGWSTTKTVNHVFAISTTYTIRMEVRDTGGLSDAATQQVTVQEPAVNTPPQAAFNVSPGSGDTATVFSFDASGSSDAEDATSALEVRWDWEDDGSYDTGWSTDKAATHTYTTTGVHTIRMSVRDSGGLIDSTPRQVMVVAASSNTAPTAAFGVTPSTGDTTTAFSFDGSGSSDAEDATSALEVRWDWEDDGVYDTGWSTAKTANHVFAVSGTYTIRMSVRDTGGLSDAATQQVTVTGTSANTPPTAEFNVTPSIGDTNADFFFDASGSSDAEDPLEVLEVRWDWEDDGVYDTAWSAEKVAVHAFAVTGTHTIRMQVRDSGGLTDNVPRQVVVVVASSNTPPVATFDVTPGVGNTTTAFSFDGSGSSDAEDATSALEVRWDWEDDGVYDTAWSTTKTVTHTYAVTGMHTVRISVRDTGGLSDSATQQVMVEEPVPNTPPMAEFNVGPSSGDTTTVFAFDGSSSSDAEDPPEVIEVRWDWEDDGVYDTGWSTDKAATHTYGATGIHTIRMEVRDTGGLIDNVPRQVMVVEAGSNTPPTAAFDVTPGMGDTATIFAFDGSGSSDAEDATSALEVRWDWEDDGTYDTGWSTDKAAAYTYVVPGIHTIRIEVRDTGGLSDSVTQQVMVEESLPNAPPMAEFNVDPSTGDTSTVFSFDGSGSSDAEDPVSALEVRWDWEDDGVYDTGWSTTKAVTHTYAVTGVHTIRMEVRDSGGLTDNVPRQVMVVEVGSNTPPTAEFDVSPGVGETDTVFSFDASGSSDAEDPTSALEVRWDWEDDGVYDTGWSTTKAVTHTYAVTGVHTIRMEVRDSGGLTDNVPRQVVVLEASSNTPPTAAFDVTPSTGDTTTVFSFDGSGSSDAEDPTSALEVRWDWEDDGVYDTGWSTTKTANHTFAVSDTYMIRIEVRDTGGLTGDATRQVTVEEVSGDTLMFLPLVVRNFP